MKAKMWIPQMQPQVIIYVIVLKNSHVIQIWGKNTCNSLIISILSHWNNSAKWAFITCSLQGCNYSIMYSVWWLLSVPVSLFGHHYIQPPLGLQLKTGVRLVLGGIWLNICKRHFISLLVWNVNNVDSSLRATWIA